VNSTIIKKSILVIGGSGFMGSHTADVLTEQGALVTILDQVNSPWLGDNQRMIVGDAMSSDDLDAAMQGIDYVYYFSGIADIGEAKSKPYDTINSNVMGLTKALDAAVKNKIEQFIYASTMYVYSPYGSFYRASKQAAEIIVEAYHEEYALTYVFLRYGSLYGPRSQDWNGVKKFVKQLVGGNCIDYSGDGSEVREYIHVRDAAKLSTKILDSSYSNKAITITGQQAIRVSDMFSMLFEIEGKTLNVNYQNSQGSSSHYGNTPYRYTPKNAIKIIPTDYIDLGQGLLDIVEEIHQLKTLENEYRKI